MPNEMSEEESALLELCPKAAFWNGREWYLQSDGSWGNPRVDYKAWLWKLPDHLNTSDEICATHEQYRHHREEAGPRLRYWAYVTRETANQTFEPETEDWKNFADLLGHYLAAEAVRYGQNKVVRTTQLEEILTEWIRNPPYATFWPEVQKAYLKRLESPAPDGYEEYDAAKTLISDFDSKIAASSREEGQRGEKTAEGADDVQSITGDAGSTTFTSSAAKSRELSAADFVSLFPYVPPESAGASTAG